MPDPLAGLDDIPWHDVVDWHGTGEAIPSGLRDLTTENHDRGLRLLQESLEHQGGIVPATVLTVPFLGRLLVSGRCVEPEGVASLLRQISSACSGILETDRALARPAGSLDVAAYPLILPPDATGDLDDVFADYDLPTWALEIETLIQSVLDTYSPR